MSVSYEVSINTDKRDLINNSEVVYKPTTEENNKFDKSFHSLKPENEIVPKDSGYLYITAFIADLLGFVAGIGFAWTSPVLPKLQGPDNPLSEPIDASQASIIASILCVGAAFGPFIFGYAADKIGRKKTLIVTALPMMVSLGILAYTDQVKLYYLARILHGMGNGGVFTVLTMYTGEITQDHNRGKFCCIMGIFIALGLLFPFSIGPLLSVKLFCLSSIVPLLIFLAIFPILAPETPGYLVTRGNIDQAETALVKLRSKSKNEVKPELNEIMELIESEKNEKGGIVFLFRSRAPRKAFMIAGGLMIIQQVSGINAVTGFLENIFLATGSSIPPQIATTLIGVIQVFTVFITSSLIEKLGRKILLLSSALGLAVSVTLLGLYFFLSKHQFAFVTYIWWLPIVSLIFYIICFNLGVGPVSWTMVSELFPSNVKSSATAMVSATNFGVSFLITLAFPLISEMLGMAQSFWLFGVCCILGAVFILLVVPETKGKTAAEIQQMLNK